MKKKDVKKNSRTHQAGFMTAEFLFAFTMVLCVGVLIFAITFSLTTIEVAQYIVWSSARSYSSANATQTDSVKAGQSKYSNLIAMFPLLTGKGNSSPWFKLSDTVTPGDLAGKLTDAKADNNTSSNSEVRHPWTGVQTEIDLILFKNVKLPFLGPITNDKSAFVFPVRALLLRHPSVEECRKFFEQKFTAGIQKLKDVSEEIELSNLGDASAYVPIEDNGC